MGSEREKGSSHSPAAPRGQPAVAKIFYVREADMVRLLQAIGPDDVYAAVRRERGPEFYRLDKVPGAELALRQPRPSSSMKAFLQPARERVAVYTLEGVDEAESCPACGRRALVGVRACDLEAIRYLDKVFAEGECTDPFYQSRRRAEVLISVDCVAVHENCFCTALGGRPFAESGFDLNLTPITNGYLIEVGTDKGRGIIEKAGSCVTEATAAQIAEREKARKQSADSLEKQNRGLKIPDKIQEILLARQKSGEGLEVCGECVECAACTFICPTCYCFYLYDQATGGEKFERLRTWDSCILGDYSRMAGPPGAKPTPRPRLRSRFVNRLLHKYAYGPQQFGLLGCVGCGRCIEACFGKIDVREVLREIGRDASR